MRHYRKGMYHGGIGSGTLLSLIAKIEVSETSVNACAKILETQRQHHLMHNYRFELFQV